MVNRGALQGKDVVGHLSLFLNTEDTEFTEYHPAHFDKASAASRQQMTRNLRTPSRQPHPPLGESWGGAPHRASHPPPPPGRVGEGLHRASHPPPPPGRVGEGLHRASHPPSPPGRVGEGLHRASHPPPPPGRVGEGLSPAPWGGLGRGSLPPLGEGRGGALGGAYPFRLC